MRSGRYECTMNVRWRTRKRVKRMQGRMLSEGTTRRDSKAYRLRHCAALILLVASGCGNERELAPVTGKVIYQGKPLSFGTVMLQAPSGQPATGRIRTDGTFELETCGEGGGAPVGEMRVRVLCFECQGPNPPKDGSQGQPLIPHKYTSYESSGLTFEVKPGQRQELIIDVTDP